MCGWCFRGGGRDFRRGGSLVRVGGNDLRWCGGLLRVCESDLRWCGRSLRQRERHFRLRENLSNHRGNIFRGPISNNQLLPSSIYRPFTILAPRLGSVLGLPKTLDRFVVQNEGWHGFGDRVVRSPACLPAESLLPLPTVSLPKGANAARSH
jgi:hypothetical protein